MPKSMRVGGGGRFAALVKKIGGGVARAKAIAASIGRKKYGKAKMSQMSAAGRHRAAVARGGGSSASSAWKNAYRKGK